jgi:hypothetical protein
VCDFTCSYGFILAGLGTPIPYTTTLGPRSVCVQGLSGGDGYTERCGFSCGFGYCPPDTCSYTLYGDPYTFDVPPETGTSGILIATMGMYSLSAKRRMSLRFGLGRTVNVRSSGK